MLIANPSATADGTDLFQDERPSAHLDNCMLIAKPSATADGTDLFQDRRPNSHLGTVSTTSR
jgi:hypothetical protein